MERRRGLSWRIAGVVTALVAGLVLAAVGAIWVRTARVAKPALETAVMRARDRVEDAVASRLDRLDLVTRLLANDAPFRAYVAEADAASILDNLDDRAALYGCDALLATSPEGVVLADTRRRSGIPVELGSNPIVAHALRGESARGVWVEPDGAISLAAAAPLFAEGAGAIVALESVDGNLLAALVGSAGSELAFFSLSGPSGTVRAGATTLPLSRSEIVAHLGDAGLAARVADPGGRAERPVTIEVDGEEFVAVVTPLDGGEGAVSAGFVALRSVDRELAAFRKIQGTLLAVGLVAMPIALLAAVLLARRITRPLALLVRATERVRAGEYDVPLPADGGDELGALATAFRGMVGQLRAREEMDAWLGGLVTRLGTGERPLQLDPTRTDVPRRGEWAEGARLLDRFVVLERIGAGAMGTVWKVRDERLGEIVAVKVLPAASVAVNPDLRERFRQEIKLARRITHRNVLRTHELLEIEGDWAILMEHVQGVSLDRVLGRGRLPLAAGLRIGAQICAGLEAAHAEGIVHRDLKPSNILMDTAGTVKIADFGLARLSGGGESATRAGSVLGTPRYMSPEQAAGNPAELRSDVYSAGVVLYEILCGRSPYEATGALEWIRAHREQAPLRPRVALPELPAALEEVLLRALRKDPSERFHSAKELGEALGAAAVGVPA